jgi:hypothetical protein
MALLARGPVAQVAQPQDVTSSGLDTEGSICSQRSYLIRRKDLLATSPKAYHHHGLVVEMNIQADGGRDVGFEKFLVVQRGRRG